MTIVDIEPSRLIEPFNCSFDRVVERFAQLPRMYCEPDGAFVWAGERDGGSWQVDGLLEERAGRLFRVQLKGLCPLEQLDQLLRCVGWPDVRVCFQDLRQGIFLTDQEFRRILGHAPVSAESVCGR